MAAEVCSSDSRERPHKTVRAPSSARVKAMALPMPRPAPVMTATCPANGGFDAVFVKTSSSQITLFYFAAVVLCIEGICRKGHLYQAALSRIEAGGRNSASKPLALAGLHPYNPLTGIILSRRIPTGGP